MLFGNRRFHDPTACLASWAGFMTAMILAGTVSAQAGQEVVVDGVPHVRNPSTPPQGVETLHLQEIWSVGGPGEEDVLFGLVSDIGGDEDGNCYIMDAQLCQVHVYSPEGQWMRTLFRQGEGPGEVQSPRDMVLLGDGSVGLVEEFPGKIVRVDRTGHPLNSITPGAEDPTRGGWVGLIMACSRGGRLIYSGQHPGEDAGPGKQARVYFLESQAEDGGAGVRYLQTETLWDFSDFVFSETIDTPPFWWAMEIGPDGRIYTVADRDRYAISVYRPDGTLERVIERDFELWKRTPEERERARLLYESAVGGMSIPYRIDIEAFEPAISYWHRALRVDDDGMLWVVSSRGIREQPNGIMLTYDVFDPAGHFVKQVAVACEGDGFGDVLFFLGDDRIVQVKGYMDALAAQFGRGTAFTAEGEEHMVPEVVYYRIAD